MKNPHLLALAALLLLSGCSDMIVVAADGCRFTAGREATLPVSDASGVKVVARAGQLRIDGRPGLSEVRVRGTACASSQDRLDAIQLVAERRGAEIYIEARIPEGGGWNDHGHLDLAIEAPNQLVFDVEDGSGGLEIRGVAALQLKDGSGGIQVSDIAGDLTIEDGSGGLEVDQVGGTAHIRDGSGGIQISNVAGDLTIRDGSGGIEIAGIKGNANIRDGSGGIDANRVAGDFVVESDGSGGVHYADVSGHVSVPKRR